MGKKASQKTAKANQNSEGPTPEEEAASNVITIKKLSREERVKLKKAIKKKKRNKNNTKLKEDVQREKILDFINNEYLEAPNSEIDNEFESNPGVGGESTTMDQSTKSLSQTAASQQVDVE